MILQYEILRVKRGGRREYETDEQFSGGEGSCLTRRYVSRKGWLIYTLNFSSVSFISSVSYSLLPILKNSKGGNLMTDKFIRQEVKTVYREIRNSRHGEELRWLVNRETIVNSENGEAITRSALRHPGICVMVAFLAEDQIILMHQYRYAVDKVLWELPAGTLNGREENNRMIATETSFDCAARELLEETGYEASHLEKVCECYAMPGMSDEIIHVYFAGGLTLREQSLDIGELIYEVRPFSALEIMEMIRNGEICDAKTLIGLFYALSRRPQGVKIW